MLDVFALEKLGETFLEFAAIVRHQLFRLSIEAELGTLESLRQTFPNYFSSFLQKGKDVGKF
jgi:hypothetical protein